MNVLMGYTTGLTLYFIVIDENGYIWDGASFSIYSEFAWESYVVPLTETLAEVYQGDFPVANTISGIYSLVGYQQDGVTPDFTDTPISWGRIAWTGTEEAIGCVQDEFELSAATANVGELVTGEAVGQSDTSIVTGETFGESEISITASETFNRPDIDITTGQTFGQSDFSLFTGVR